MSLILNDGVLKATKNNVSVSEHMSYFDGFVLLLSGVPAVRLTRISKGNEFFS